LENTWIDGNEGVSEYLNRWPNDYMHEGRKERRGGKELDGERRAGGKQLIDGWIIFVQVVWSASLDVPAEVRVFI
jgi:hypothetical protein